ncbi:MAG: homoserine dehydrogenase [Candidatus Euphemobacter frigidus]|nr:homoserine dehydrogenase [Candidatus Euphemobacter frigidus]MDP8275292.1 homoserine dehydrogenase [Candidatus Euphemobacter frigidus]
MRRINIGLIGWGTVGTGVIKILRSNAAHISRRTGVSLRIRRVADLDLKRVRGIKIPPSILTRKASQIIEDPEIQVVVELTGGLESAQELIIESLRKGKQVVTANKALLARKGKILFREARKNNRRIFFEASVGGGIPIIKILQEGLAANKISSVLGIINGTTNYILSRMTEDRISLEMALQEAQINGYAEKDPTLDLSGVDSAHKLVLLASLAFGGWIDLKKVYVEGINEITDEDIEYTGGLGYTIKLLAIAKQTASGVDARVHPTLVNRHHLLASVDGVFNAIYLEGDYSDRQIFQGKGAGEGPTASAIVADLIEAGKEILTGNLNGPGSLLIDDDLKMASMGEVECRHYIRIPAVDRPGVLAQIASILGSFNISIASVIQRGQRRRGVVPIILMTHLAKEKALKKAVARISRLPMVKGRPLRLRVED